MTDKLVEDLREESRTAQRVGWYQADGGQDYAIAAQLADAAADRIELLTADLASTLARAEKAEAELAKLADPNAVHVSMLAGTVAKPSWQQIKHIYAEEAERAEAALAEAVEALRFYKAGCDWQSPPPHCDRSAHMCCKTADATLAKLEAKP